MVETCKEGALEARLSALEKLVDERDDRARNAIDRFEQQLDKRFASVNEFRMALGDQTQTYMPRSEYQVQHAALSAAAVTNSDRITALEARVVAHKEGLTSTQAFGVLIASAFATMVSLVTVIFNIVAFVKH